MTTLLDVRDLHAHYGKSHVLRGVAFQVPEAGCVSIVGRNGSGRSTTLKAIVGLLPVSAGSVRLGARELAGERAFRIARCGVAYVPEERLVFPNLTVEENLRLGLQARATGPKWRIDEMYGHFPRLAERRTTHAGRLSGGEQQMLTLCRSLLGQPRLILIDEPTEGLAPQIVEQVLALLREIRRRGVAVVLVEQRLTIALEISERLFVMGHGAIVYDGTPDALRDNAEIQRRWLSASGDAAHA